MAAVSPSHRTQEERRAQTQAKVLDATLESLLDYGYGQTTIRRVAALAGVSPGAVAHYYPRRVDLVASATERLVEQRLRGWSTMAEALPEAPDERLAAIADRLWEDFSSPLFAVFVKLWIAAAEDAELHGRLAVAERRLSRAISELADEAIGDMRGPAGWEGRLLLALAAVRGLALMEHFEPRTEQREDPWPSVRAALIDVFETWRRREVQALQGRSRRHG